MYVSYCKKLKLWGDEDLTWEKFKNDPFKHFNIPEKFDMNKKNVKGFFE